jgi:integrase
MKIFEMKEDPLIIQWLDNINKSTTKNNYLLGMQVYTEWLKKTPDALIDEAEEEATVLMRKRKITRYMIGFKKYLHDSTLAPLTQKNYITGVKAFYTFNYIELPKLKSDKAKPLKQNKDIPSKEDLQDALRICDPLEKAVLLVGASSGLASNEICNLLVSDFKNGYDPVTGITTLDLRREKVELDFITFLTPEASKAVMDYLTYRARTVKTGEAKRLRQLEKQRVISEKGYLFITRKVTDDYLIDHDEEKRKLNKDTFMKLYRDISEKAQKNTQKGNWNLLRSHNVRRWFNTTLLNAGIGFFYVEELMGHTLPTTQEHYYVRSPEKLKEIYQKYVPYLTIQKSLDISESQDYKNVVEERDHYKAMAEQYFVNGLELINAKYELQRLKNKTMTDDERKQALIDFTNNLKPETENDVKLKTEMKKVLGIE